jgi:transcriptional regulator with XRE-family HTH domain
VNKEQILSAKGLVSMRKRLQRKSQKFLKNLGISIRQRRLSFDTSQEELAKLCGVHRSYITEIESGLRNVSVLTLHKLAVALNCETWELLRFDQDEAANEPDQDEEANESAQDEPLL